MNATDLLEVLGRANLVLAAGVTLVLVLRRPWRQQFGSDAAYQLWALVPLVFAASWLPAASTPLANTVQPIARGIAGAVQTRAGETREVVMGGFEAGSEPLPLATILLTVWAAGIALALTGLALRQRRFACAAREGRGGPAVSGFLRPRIVTPDDFTARFEPAEQDVILAHERVHLKRQDARINGALELIQCLCWFNPLVWIGARYLRLDQELACDAAVVRRHPDARGQYASAMLKTQLQSAPLPLGCYWPARGAHPLTERIAMLKRPAPSAARRGLALAALAAVTSVAGLAAWNTQSAQASPGRVGVAIHFPPPTVDGSGIIPFIPPPDAGIPFEPTVPLINVMPDAIYLGDREMSFDQLVYAIRTELPENESGVVILRADRHVSYGHFMSVLNQFNDAGLTNLALIAEDL
jgi:beta-lactamase regulating signal transducer with metallopeptidase domain